MSDEKTKVMRVTTVTLNTLRELSDRTKIDMVVLLDDIFKQVQLQLDLMTPNKRLVFMADFYNRDNVPKTIIRLSDALDSSFAEIPAELQKDVLKAFGYSDDGRFIDLRLQKKSDVDPIQQKPRPPDEKKE